jgi:hypothetical protein
MKIFLLIDITRCMHNKILRGLATGCCYLSLTGCFGAGDVGLAELNVQVRNSDSNTQKAICQRNYDCPKLDLGPSIGGRINYANALAGEYMRLADSASRAQDWAALGIISSAGVAAGALAYDANVNLLKGAGLSAAMIAAGRNYAKPGESVAHLLNAAEGMLCVASAARSANPAVQDASAGLVDDAINSIRLDLRKKLERQAPNYRDIVEAAKAADVDRSTGRQAFFTTVNGLSIRLDACVSKVVLSGST